MLMHVRVSVPDRPGVLAKVTTVLADASADIRTIAVLEREAGRAVDDIYLAWPDDRPRSAVADHLVSVRGVTVLGMRASREVPGAFPDLDLLTQVLATSSRGLDTLVDMAVHAFGADWAASVAYTGDLPQVLYTNASPGDEIVLPPAGVIRPTSLEQDGVQLAAVPLAPFAGVLVCGRSGPPPFHRVELERMRRVTELAVGLVRPDAVVGS